MAEMTIIVDSSSGGASAAGMPQPPGGTLSGGRTESMLKKVAVDSEVFSNSVKGMTETLTKTFEEARTVSGASLDTATVSLEVSAEGGVSLIGSAKASVTGAIELTFKFT